MVPTIYSQIKMSAVDDAGQVSHRELGVSLL
jgi:hypothetical protein